MEVKFYGIIILKKFTNDIILLLVIGTQHITSVNKHISSVSIIED